MIKIDKTILIILKILKRALKVLNLILILNRNLILDSKFLEVKKGATAAVLKRIFIINAYRLSESV